VKAAGSVHPLIKGWVDGNNLGAVKQRMREIVQQGERDKDCPF
jgi:hypothetical protein